MLCGGQSVRGVRVVKDDDKTDEVRATHIHHTDHSHVLAQHIHVLQEATIITLSLCVCVLLGVGSGCGGADDGGLCLWRPLGVFE